MKNQEAKHEKKHPNDQCIFAVPSVVLINRESSELFLIDKVSFGFGTSDTGRPIDLKKVEAAGFEILGDL